MGGRRTGKPILYGATLFPTKEDFLREEEKFSKEPKFKNFKFRERKNFEKIFLQVCCDYHSVFGLSFDAYICVCARVKDKKFGVSPDVDAVKYQKIRFKALFSVTERTKTENGIVIGYWQNKRSDGLKNRLFGFYVNFCL